MKAADPIDTARLSLALTDLRLPAIKLVWPDFAARSDKEGWPAARFLAALAEHEMAERARRRIERHLDEARLPPGEVVELTLQALWDLERHLDGRLGEWPHLGHPERVESGTLARGRGRAADRARQQRVGDLLGVGGRGRRAPRRETAQPSVHLEMVEGLEARAAFVEGLARGRAEAGDLTGVERPAERTLHGQLQPDQTADRCAPGRRGDPVFAQLRLAGSLIQSVVHAGASVSRTSTSSNPRS